MAYLKFYATGSTFTYNQAASSSGGALYASTSTLTISSCTFTSNYASSGGAIYLENACAMTLDSTSFTSNSAASNGGALAVVKSSTSTDDYNSITISNCATLTYNSAGSSGGFIYVANAYI